LLHDEAAPPGLPSTIAATNARCAPQCVLSVARVARQSKERRIHQLQQFGAHRHILPAMATTLSIGAFGFESAASIAFTLPPE
jgi:hypothetical protein